MYSKAIVCTLMIYPKKFKIILFFKLLKLISKCIQTQKPIFVTKKGRTRKESVTSHIDTCFQVWPRGNFWFSVSKPNIYRIKSKC